MGASPSVARLRAFGRRHRVPITVVGSLATAAILVYVLAGRRHEFAHALASASIWILLVAVVLQIVALLARTEAWHLTIEAAGGTVARRVLYRASGMQVLGGAINGHLGVAVRIAALRRSSPEVSPQVPTLVAAEFPILAVEAGLAALTSFTLIGPLGLPWWLPLVAIAVVGGDQRGPAAARARQGPRAVEGPDSAAPAAQRQPRDRLRPGRRVRADLPQLDASARGRRARFLLRRHRSADRRGHAQPAARRARASAPLRLS